MPQTDLLLHIMDSMRKILDLCAFVPLPDTTEQNQAGCQARRLEAHCVHPVDPLHSLLHTPWKSSSTINSLTDGRFQDIPSSSGHRPHQTILLIVFDLQGTPQHLSAVRILHLRLRTVQTSHPAPRPCVRRDAELFPRCRTTLLWGVGKRHG